MIDALIEALYWKWKYYSAVGGYKDFDLFMEHITENIEQYVTVKDQNKVISIVREKLITEGYDV